MPKKVIHYYIFGFQGCPYYEKAIELVKSYPHYAHSFKQNSSEWQYILDILKSKIGSHKTSPIVFNGNKFIGGHDDLVKYLKLKMKK